MANILQSNVFLSITTMIMDRALDARSRSFTESHLQKVRRRNWQSLLYITND